MSSRRLPKSSGQTLIEMLVAVAIGAIVSLGVASVFTFGITQFQILVEQNQAETNLLGAAYYLRSWLGQAVKTTCVNGTYGLAVGALVPTLANTTVTLDTSGAGDGSAPNNGLDIPATLGKGIVDCRLVPDASNGSISNDIASYRWSYDPATIAANYNVFAAFLRENGQGDGTGSIYSQYVASGIFFLPPPAPTDAVYTAGAWPNGYQSGTLIFAQAGAPAATINSATGYVRFDHIVDIGIIDKSLTPAGLTTGQMNGAAGAPNLEAAAIRLVVRYYMETAPQKDYRSGATNQYGASPGGAYRDLEMIVPIAFRDNFLSKSATGTNTSERLYGSLYFFKFTAPPLSGTSL